MLKFYIFLVFIAFGCKTSKQINKAKPVELNFSGSSILYLEKIEIHPSYTRLNFSFHNKTISRPSKNGIHYSTSVQIGINSKIRLYDNENLKSYQFIEAKRIPIQPEQIVIRQFNKYNFSLIFQKLDKITKRIDIIECENNGYTSCWNFYDINLENEVVEYFEK